MPDNTLTVGNVSITSLSDGLLEFDLCNFFPSVPEDQWQPYRDHLSPEGKVSFNLAAFLIRSEGKNILVDTGLGPKPADAPETPWGELSSWAALPNPPIRSASGRFPVNPVWYNLPIDGFEKVSCARTQQALLRRQPGHSAGTRCRRQR